MAVRGTEAKNYVIKKLKEAFGSDFLGEVDGKVYLRAPEGSEKIQVNVSLACPKKEMATMASAPTFAPEKSGGAFSLTIDDAPPPAVKSAVQEVEKSFEITQSETDNLKKLLKELGL